MVKARSEEMEQRWEQLAWHAAWCISVHVPKGKRLTVDEMLGRSKKQSGIAWDSLDDFKRDMRQRRQRELAKRG